MKQPRCYKSLKYNTYSYREELARLLMSDYPVFAIRLGTTGVNTNIDQVLQVSVSKCHFSDYNLEVDDEFYRIIRINKEVSDERLKMLDIDRTDFEKADTAEVVMKELIQFIGSDTLNIIGFYISDFLKPFLDLLGFYGGHMLKIDNYVDLYQVAYSNLEKNEEICNYKFHTLCDCFDVSFNEESRPIVDLFNVLYERIPIGQVKANVLSTKYWKSGTKEYIVINTECGSLGLNCSTGYFKEKTPGIFDVIDLDYLTQYICEKQNCKDIYQFIEKFKALVDKKK